MDKSIVKYLSQIGRRGGLKSRRTLSSEHARDMVRVREARRAFKIFKTKCFWSFDPDYKITAKDLPWVIEQIKKHGTKEVIPWIKRLCH